MFLRSIKYIESFITIFSFGFVGYVWPFWSFDGASFFKTVFGFLIFNTSTNILPIIIIVLSFVD